MLPVTPLCNSFQTETNTKFYYLSTGVMSVCRLNYNNIFQPQVLLIIQTLDFAGT